MAARSSPDYASRRHAGRRRRVAGVGGSRAPRDHRRRPRTRPGGGPRRRACGPGASAARAASFTATERTAGDWHGTVSAIEQRWKAAFEPNWRRSGGASRFRYPHTSYVGPDRLAASGYGWKARLFTDAAEGFLWIRPSKTEAGIVRLVGDGPDEPSARTLLALGRRLLAAVPA